MSLKLNSKYYQIMAYMSNNFVMLKLLKYEKEKNLVWFGLIWFYGISTIVDYLMPNPFLYM